MKAFHVTITREAGMPWRFTIIARDWLDVHTSAIEQFFPCSVFVRPA